MAIRKEIVVGAGQSAKRRRRQLERIGFRRQVHSTVSGLACNCVRDAVSRGLNGYRLTRLNGYRLTVLEPGGLSGLGQETGTLALEPVSDKKALENAIRYFQRARATAGNLSGLGDTAQAQSAASYAAAGAKVGSIVPGIGTVIGAVVGAVVGWLAGKSKPVRASAEQINACRSYVTEYMGYASQTPNAPLPMEYDQLKETNWCIQALFGGDIKLKDPRWFDNTFVNVLTPVARSLVKKIYETPVGQVVKMEQLSYKDQKGRTWTFQGREFTNPQFTDLKTFTDSIWIPMAIQICENVSASGGFGGCGNNYRRPESMRLLYDLLAWAARTELPNISEADLKAASQVAADTGSSAKDVVKAVASIINRDVVKGETSLLLTGQSDTPVQVPSATPGAPPTPVTSLPEIPGMTAQTATEITDLIKTLVNQGQQNSEIVASALNELDKRGVNSVAAKEVVENEVAAQTAPAINPLVIGSVIGGGILLLIASKKRGRR